MLRVFVFEKIVEDYKNRFIYGTSTNFWLNIYSLLIYNLKQVQT